MTSHDIIDIRHDFSIMFRYTTIMSRYIMTLCVSTIHSLNVTLTLTLTVPTCRVIKTHSTPVSDTDDTEEEDRVGGLSYYSHSKKNLIHQHWIDQVISSGGFNVHCTQSSEAAHRVNMHLASRRVRFYDCNGTQDQMLKWLRHHKLFLALKQDIFPEERVSRKNKQRDSLGLPLRCSFGVKDRFTKPDCMNNFLHVEVRVAEIELVNIICDKLGLPAGSFDVLSQLTFDFGQQFTRRDGRKFWSTDTGYSLNTTKSRRDLLFLDGVVGGDALCGESICFMLISGLKKTFNDDRDDSETYALVRWLEPDDDAYERDALHRPVCPGPLHINNCLWRYSKTDRPRAVLKGSRNDVLPRSFIRQRHKFGKTREEQNACREREMHAYYSLVTTDSIVDTVNACQLFLPGTCVTDNEHWLQTVTMF